MGAVIRSVFAFVVQFFSALERTAKTLDNLAAVAEETSAQYRDSAHLDRVLAQQEAEIERLKRKLKVDAAKAKVQAAAQNQP